MWSYVKSLRCLSIISLAALTSSALTTRTSSSEPALYLQPRGSTNMTTSQGQELSDAIRTGDAAKVRTLINAGEKPTDSDIIEAYSCEFPEVNKVLIETKYLDIDEDLEAGGDMLITAVWERKDDFVKWLLENGANPNSGHLMADSTSALTAAAELGNIPTAQLLLDHKVAINGTGSLPGAAGAGKHDMIIFLVEKGANLDEIGVHDFGDRRKRVQEGTALHKVAERGDLESAKFLVGKGASVVIQDPEGRTPLDRARQAGQEEMVEYLGSLGEVTAV